MTQIAKLSDLDWLTNWASKLAPSLGEKFQLDVDGGLGIADATEEELIKAGSTLMHSKNKTSQIGRVVDRFLGDLINHYSIVHDCTWAEAIEKLNLEQEDGRSMRTLSKLPRIVSRLDPETLRIPDLTTKHFDCATSYEEPTDSDNRKKWKEGVKDILVEASLNPTERGSRWMGERMRELQQKCGVKVDAPKPEKDLLRHIVEVAYVLQKWSPSDFEDRGVERQKAVDFFESYVNEALNRSLFNNPDDPVHFKFPWETKIVEAE